MGQAGFLAAERCVRLVVKTHPNKPGLSLPSLQNLGLRQLLDQAPADRREQQHHGVQEPPAGTDAGGQHMGSMCDDMAKTPGCSTACSARAGAPKISTALRRYTPMVRVTRGILRWSESPVAEHSAPLHHIISYARTMCTVRSMSPRLHTGAKTLALGYRTWLPCVHAHLSAHVKTATTCSQAYEDKYHNFSTMLMAQLGTSLVACVLLWLVSALGCASFV